MKSILLIVPYDHLYPPVNGGMQRCFHLVCQLCRAFKTTIIIHQDARDFMKAVDQHPELASLTVYSTIDHASPKDVFSLLPRRAQHALRYRWHRRSITATADGAFLQYFPLLKKLLKTVHYDCFIIEKLSGINAVDIIRRYNRHAPIVYDAHNVDTAIATATGMLNTAEIKQLESSLYKKVQAILTCSQHDLDTFSAMNRGRINGCVVPNGVTTVPVFFDAAVHLDHPTHILFCGSLGYAPNAEGLRWFYDEVWPAVKQRFTNLKVLVVGSGHVPPVLNPLVNSSDFVFLGRVPDVKTYYNQASVAIVPIKAGSGTRLKVLEAMALGIPIVSTSKGAEGIGYVEGRHLLIGDDPTTFCNALEKLLTNKQQRLNLQYQAGQLVKQQYDWNIIGVSLHRYLQQIMHN